MFRNSELIDIGCNIAFELLHVGILHQFRANLFEGLYSKILVSKYWYRFEISANFFIDIGIDIEKAQSAISFSVLISTSYFHIIEIDIGFEINACQTELLVSNLNEQFRTALLYSYIVVIQKGDSFLIGLNTRHPVLPRLSDSGEKNKKLKYFSIT